MASLLALGIVLTLRVDLLHVSVISVSSIYNIPLFLTGSLQLITRESCCPSVCLQD
jgi:hypothetical protein